MIPEDDLNELELIERFLMNQLPESEHKQLIVKLQQDTTFAMKVENTRQLMRLIQTANSELRAANTLKQLYKQRSENKFKFPVSYWIGYGMAAACVSFLLYLALATIHVPVVQDDLLIVRNQPPLQAKPGNSLSPYQQLLNGQSALNRKNYLQAATDFELVLKTDSMRPYYREASQWLLTVAYLYSNQPRRAEENYETLQKIDNPEYKVDLLERWKIYCQIQLRKWK